MNEIQVIASKIQKLPGRPPCMIDSDLATIYETTTGAINRAVKRNPRRFPEDFAFQITQEEEKVFDVPVWHIKKDGRGGRRRPTFVFTREGANMLSAVLRTPVAAARSVQIMRAFSAMERGDGPVLAAIGRVMELLSSFNTRMEGVEERLLMMEISNKVPVPPAKVGRLFSIKTPAATSEIIDGLPRKLPQERGLTRAQVIIRRAIINSQGLDPDLFMAFPQ